MDNEKQKRDMERGNRVTAVWEGSSPIRGELMRRIETALESLRKSSFRARFYLGERERAHFREKGADAIRGHARDFINSRLAPEMPRNDGRQTPMRGHPVFIAQHATGTCCRGCLEKWHGIPKGRPLSGGEIDFVVELIMAWITLQMEREP